MKIKQTEIEAKIHPLWESSQKLIKDKTFMKSMLAKCTIGKYKYDFESPKGKISLIQLATYCPRGWEWEIFAYDNPKLFTDVMRFKTKTQAVKAINKYLE